MAANFAVITTRKGSKARAGAMENASGVKVVSHPQRRQREHGPKTVHIIAHLGSTDKEYLLAIASFRPAQCPQCGGGRVHRHDEFWRQGEQQQVPIQRFRCARVRCRRVFSVLPSYLPPGQSYAAASEEAAVAAYVSGAAPLDTSWPCPVARGDAFLRAFVTLGARLHARLQLHHGLSQHLHGFAKKVAVVGHSMPGTGMEANMACRLHCEM